MKEWLLLTLGAVICWGGWAFLPKLSVQLMDTERVLVYQGLGGLIVALLVFLQLGDRTEAYPKAVIFAIIAGILNGLGVLLYVKAISKGPISVIVTLSALYPLVTVALAVVILQKSLTLKQMIGVGLAIFSMILITID